MSGKQKPTKALTMEPVEKIFPCKHKYGLLRNCECKTFCAEHEADKTSDKMIAIVTKQIN